MKLNLLVKTNSRQEGIEKLADGTLRVKVNAPPAEGRANEAVIRLLAGHFGVPRSSITILRGVTSRRKVVQVAC